MQVDDVVVMPAINRIIEDATSKIESLLGRRARVKLHIRDQGVTEEEIQQAVCDAFDVRWRDIISRSRKEGMKDARHVYWFLMIKYLGATTVYLANQCGRDHSTIIHARDRIRVMIQENSSPVTNNLIKKIESEFL
jgi:chromosomal replication initiation ATPase DnaA